MNYNIGVHILILIAAVMVMEASTSAIKRSSGGGCNAKNLCNYGGKCDEWEGFCTCRFDCRPELWPGKYYCGPQQPGRRRKYYANLCELLAHACEMQTDIPIVEFNMDRMQCDDDILPAVTLCSRPQDHMGPCGGSTAMDGSIGAGVCLVESVTYNRRCACPNNKEGVDCYVTRDVFNVENLSEDEPTNNHQELRFALKIVAITFIAMLMLAVTSCLLMKRFRANRRQRREHLTVENKSSSVNRRDDLTKMISHEQTKGSHPSEAITQDWHSETGESMSQKPEIVNMDLPPHRRGRLSGEALVMVPVKVSPTAPCGNEEGYQFDCEKNITTNNNNNNKNNNNKTNNI